MCVFYKLKHKILNVGLLARRKSPIIHLFLFESFTAKRSSRACLMTVTSPHFNLPVSVYLPLSFELSLSHTPSTSPFSDLPYPHISIFGGTQLKTCLVFPAFSLLTFTDHTRTQRKNCDILPHVPRPPTSAVHMCRSN